MELNLPTKDGNVSVGDIIYHKGVLQGDYLSMILFILSLNPLSYLLKKEDGYNMGSSEERDKLLVKVLTHLFFADDFKLYAPTLNQIKYLLDIVTTFSKDIGMAFGEDKCGYIYVERGKRKSQGQDIVINGVTIKELEEEECYKYLGIDEDIEYNRKINKERVLKKYYRRVRTIWKSQLNERNKTIAHNTFAVAILIPTIGILDWTLKELEEVDAKTSKVLCMTGNFQWKSDVNRLYVKRMEGGRGLKKFEDCFKTRMVAIRRHLIRDRKQNHLLENVMEHEKDRTMRIGEQYKRMYTQDEEVKDEKISDKIKNEINKKDKDEWHAKQQHRYLFRMIAKKEDTDHKGSYLWMKKATERHT